MKISGFTMVRNADLYYFPIKESIESILPIVDEFIVALGNCDPEDKTRALIESINSDKIVIIDRVWDEEEFLDGKIFATETNFALSQCTGDWCFYLQADEVVHEKDLKSITTYCKQYLTEDSVDGFLFNYYHFWGDYKHHLPVHCWYKNEIRIVRNKKHIYSYKDAQSFRKNKDEKLTVIEIEPYIYHYGWVRPPQVMQSKRKEQESMHHDSDQIQNEYELKAHEFDYGYLGAIPTFEGKHPSVMSHLISKMFWKSKLNYTQKGKLNRPKMKHEKFKYKMLTWIENVFYGRKTIFGYSNWKKLN
ncbi:MULTISPECIES: hypothetical protein [unclassified Aureispira]|uniref:hypothetical protein n=1 Tax=unclassified Aureispira TaxID=2649989 RepID=UPI000697EF81|nr:MULTISPECIES: hypothetical protein [unclassified Aureispira]WMX14256.1 glycosyltransferase family 2 protein [Aureispira sp. CCB-E]